MKDASNVKTYLILLFILLTCSVFLASCFGDSDNSSPAFSASNTQTSAFTPIGVPVTCLTVNSPSLVKLPDGHYKLVDEINNCGGKMAGPLKITTQINTPTTKHNTILLGPPTIPAKGKAVYQTYTGQSGPTEKEIDFLSPGSSPVDITLLVTIKGAVQGEWDGQVTIPGS